MYNSSAFELKYSFENDTMTLYLQILLPHVSTSAVPHAIKFLTQHSPGVLRTKCFNDAGLPFFIEAKNTELGHLFEHLLLDQLCYKKISNGHESAEFRGITQWDWENEPYGSFRITIHLPSEDLSFFAKSLQSTITIFEKFIESIPTKNTAYVFSPSTSHFTKMQTPNDM